MLQSPLTVLLLATLPGLAGCGQRQALQPTADGSPGCEVSYTVKAIKPLECSDRSLFTYGPVLITADSTVVYTHAKTFGSNSGTDTDIFALRTGSGDIEQITGDDADTILLSIDSSSILWARREGKQPPERLYLRTDHKTVDLGHHTLDHRWPGFVAYGPGKLVDGGRAAWRTKDAVYLYDGTTTHKIASLGKQVNAGDGPYLNGGAVVWSHWDGKDLEIYLFKDGKTQKLTENSTPDRYPVVSAGRVFWSCDGDICLWEAGTSRRLDQGQSSCGEPDAHLGVAAWICDNRVSLYDPLQGVRRLTGDGGGKLQRFGVRLHSGRLIWLEIRDPEQSQYVEKATLVFSDGRQQQDVTEVGLPCMACNAYWPPLALSLSSNVLAWTYANPLPSAHPPYEFCAYAEIEGRSHCAP